MMRPAINSMTRRARAPDECEETGDHIGRYVSTGQRAGSDRSCRYDGPCAAGRRALQPREALVVSPSCANVAPTLYAT